MADDMQEFQQKLRNYADGNMTEEEQAAFERELEKMETYQTFLEAELGEHPSTLASSDRSSALYDLDERSERRILFRSKWKSRLTSGFFNVLFVLLAIASVQLVTLIFYATGGQYDNRANDNRDVIVTTIETTEPNLYVDEQQIDVRTRPFFTLDTRMDLYKQIGRDPEPVGEFEMRFVLNEPQTPHRNLIIAPPPEIPTGKTIEFAYPTAGTQLDLKKGWERLAKLPEGTVAEAYVSFQDFVSPNQVPPLFEDAALTDLWYAVDTGVEKEFAEEYALATPVGYRAQTKTPDDFKKDLRVLADHAHLAEDVARAKELYLDQRVAYVEQNGVRLYGVAVTGPTKEILKLQQHPNVRGIQIGEVRLWNW